MHFIPLISPISFSLALAPTPIPRPSAPHHLHPPFPITRSLPIPSGIILIHLSTISYLLPNRNHSRPSFSQHPNNLPRNHVLHRPGRAKRDPANVVLRPLWGALRPGPTCLFLAEQDYLSGAYSLLPSCFHLFLRVSILLFLRLH